MNQYLVKALQIITIILLGMLGMGLYSTGEHLYVDHVNLHELIRMVQIEQQKQVKP